MVMELVAIPYTVELSMMKISLENIQVQEFYLWLIVEEILIPANFLLPLRHVLTSMISMLYLVS